VVHFHRPQSTVHFPPPTVHRSPSTALVPAPACLSECPVPASPTPLTPQDPVLFCLAADLGSKTTGEWEKAPFVSGWSSMPGE
jgi:hypothetical protein